MNENPQKRMAYTLKPKTFDGYNKEVSVQQALGSDRTRRIFEVAELRSTNYVPGVSGWRLTPNGLELAATSTTFPDGTIPFSALTAIATSRILGRSTAGTGAVESLTASQVKTILAILSTDISDFIEAAQDAIGAMIVDTNTIDLTYVDATPALKADVRYQDSATIDLSDDASGLKASIIEAYKHKTLFDHYADVGNVGTGEDDLYSDTIAAAQLANNGEKLEAEYGGTFVSSATATRELKAYFGGTLIFDTGALTLSLSSTWTLWIVIIRESSSVVRCMASLTTQGAALAAYTQYTRVTGLTLANTQVLKITGEAAGVGAATDDIVAKLGTVLWHSAA